VSPRTNTRNGEENESRNGGEETVTYHWWYRACSALSNDVDPVSAICPCKCITTVEIKRLLFPKIMTSGIAGNKTNSRLTVQYIRKMHEIYKAYEQHPWAVVMEG